MASENRYVLNNLQKIVENVVRAAESAGRSANDVRIMAVTKTVDPELVNLAVQNGITLLGENRVQEYLGKRDFYDKRAEVHFIGALQTNKVRQIINANSNITLIHSVDSGKLLREISKRAGDCGKTADFLVEVNIAGEASKSGVLPSAVMDFCEDTGNYKDVRLRGLMCIPPADSGGTYFPDMYRLFSQIKARCPTADILSMGMSGDYEAAVKEGSTLVRIGSALFGSRGR